MASDISAVPTSHMYSQMNSAQWPPPLTHFRKGLVQSLQSLLCTSQKSLGNNCRIIWLFFQIIFFGRQFSESLGGCTNFFQYVLPAQKITVFNVKLGRGSELNTNIQVPSVIEVDLVASMHFYIGNSHPENIASSLLKTRLLNRDHILCK